MTTREESAGFVKRLGLDVEFLIYLFYRLGKLLTPLSLVLLSVQEELAEGPWVAHGEAFRYLRMDGGCIFK